MSKRCDFTNITADEIIRDKIINGMRNNNLRKSLITRSNLTCEMLIKICRAGDISQEQSTTLKTKETINYINSKPKKQYQEKRKEIKCRYCGGIHQFKKELCPAYGKTCAKCNRMNHYRSMCKASEKNERVQNVFSVYKVNYVRTVDTLPKCETVTLKTQWGSLIKFQIDNGASVNVIPLSVYELASKDFQHRKIKKSDTTEITEFGGTRWKIKGEVIIRVQRRNKECLIRLKIADGDQFHSILRRSASVELGCIKILDNDEKYEQVNQIQNTLDLKILMTKYLEVFDGQVGKLEGKYTIKINDKAVPVKQTNYMPYEEHVNICTTERETMARLAISDERMKRFIKETNEDDILKKLKIQTQTGWGTKTEDNPELRKYYSMRDDITVIDELLYKDNRLIVPTTLREEFMSLAHQSHGGICAYLRRMSESVYWPGMTTQIKQKVKNCEICMKYQENKVIKDPLMSHDTGTTPWSKIGVDICYFDNRTLLVTSDYYSNYITVRRLRNQGTDDVINELLGIFSTHGLPENIVCDNGPQFREKFLKFTKDHDINLVTSSPYLPQSNDKAENAVKTIKRIFKKCRDNKISEQLAILNYNNTPTEGI